MAVNREQASVRMGSIAKPLFSLKPRQSAFVRPDLSTLDVLRGAAAFYVLCNHARGALFVGGQVFLEQHANLWQMIGLALLQLTSLGAEAVILFFVVSGYAMAHSLSRSPRASDFYLRRFVRVWPPYLLAVLLVMLVGMQPGDAFWLTLYLGTDTPYTPQFWSLVYEILFYALCPLLLHGRTLRPALALAVVLTTVGVVFADDFYTPTKVLGVNFLLNGLIFFLFGAFLYDRLDLVPVVRGRLLALVIPLILGAMVILKFLVGFSIEGCLIVAALTALLLRNLGEFPGRALLTWLGSFSYSVYLYHFVLLTVLASALGGPSRNFFLWTITIPPIVAGCWLLYWLAEHPSHLALQWLRRRHRATGREESACGEQNGSRVSVRK